MSAGVRTDEQINEMPLKDYLERYGTAMGQLKEGDKRITDFWNQNSVIYLVNHLPEEQKKSVRLYLDIGDDDFLYKGNSLLHIAMRDLNIPHEYRVRNGMHNWEYWRTGLPDVCNSLVRTSDKDGPPSCISYPVSRISCPVSLLSNYKTSPSNYALSRSAEYHSSPAWNLLLKIF